MWSGRLTNDTLHPVRNLRASRESHGKQNRGEFADERPGSPEFLRRMRSRTPGRNLMDGRWSLVTQRIALRAEETAITPTQWSANIAQQLLLRHGIIMRETAVAENVPGGFPTIYPALKTMEDSGWIRRGMFVASMGAAGESKRRRACVVSVVVTGGTPGRGAGRGWARDRRRR